MQMKQHSVQIAAFVLCASLFGGCAAKEEVPAMTPEETAEAETLQTRPEPEYRFPQERLEALREELTEDREINPDVTGLLVFQSDLVHEPVLQGDDNGHYLYVDWETDEYRSYGSIMMDYRNHLDMDDMNTIIYGHYIYEARNADRTLVFTPLAELMHQENYADNRYIALVTENEVRYYELALVYDCPMENADGGQVTPDELQFNLVEYEENYFDLYCESARAHRYYDTGVTLAHSDHLLTLQTCIEGNTESREILICKELERISFGG